MDTINSSSPIAPGLLSDDKPISLAILAIGGQGGGVLSDWVVALAEGEGWRAQTTSVPGVAQRTGATIYYIEMLRPRGDVAPVFSLTPTPGDVDIVLAAEFMEAGRSMLRGLVTPDHTTLIASSHRSYAIVEKEKPGDGLADGSAVVEAAGIAAKRIIAFDMQSLAEKNGSVVSAALFGALAGAKVLPFPRDAFEKAVRAGGVAVEASLRAFGAAYDHVESGKKTPAVQPGVVEKVLPSLPAATGHKELDELVERIRTGFPAELQPMVFAGVKRLVDFQDVRYAHEYLDRLDGLQRLDREHGGAGKGFAFTAECAKYLALAMAYDDVVRVADLKTRASRFARVRAEVVVGQDQLLYTTEFMHPRMDEVAGTLPRGLGLFLESHPGLFKFLDRIVNRGRRVRTNTIGWFLVLYVLAGMKPMRRKLLRHSREMSHIEAWLAQATGMIGRDYDLAVEIIRCRRLIKGYSDTHTRGESKFERVLSALPMLTGRPDSADWLRRLRTAALADEDGKALEGALRTVASVYG